MKSLLLLFTFLLAVPALAQQRLDRASAPAGERVLSTEDQAMLDAFLESRPRTVVAARPADVPRRTPQPPTYDRGAIVFTVNSAYDDDPDTDGDGVCAGPTFGECQLRSAINEANAQPTGQAVRIEFNVTIGPSGSEIEPGTWRITLTYDPDGDGIALDLPVISGTDLALTVDGLTQPGASCGDLMDGVAHDLRIVLDGSLTGGFFNGFGFDTYIDVAGLSVRGLVIQNFPQTAIIGNVERIECNYLGTDVSGTSAAGNLFGIQASAPASGLYEITNNLISGNEGFGLRLNSPPTSATVAGNLIGTDATGTLPLGNNHGIQNVVSNVTFANNVISANDTQGMRFGYSTATSNTLHGNLVGLSRTGQPLGNGTDGILIGNTEGSPANDIGMSGEAPNWVANNGGAGIRIHGEGTDDNRFANNHVGFDFDGNAAPNAEGGIVVTKYAPFGIDGPPEGTIIGGPNAGDANHVAGNAQHGIRLTEDSNTRIEGNTIGLNHLGTVVPNVRDGIRLTGSISPLIRANTVVGNSAVGVALADDFTLERSTTGAVIQGNFIGTDASGNAADPDGTTLGNRADGIWCRHAENTLIGGVSSTTLGNTIAHNGHGATFQDGIKIAAPCANYTILKNSIYNNVGLGIDLGSEGVTPNDDADGFTNYPVIESATNDGTETTIVFTLTGAPFQEIRYAFFTSDSPDPSGFGEGRFWRTGQEISLGASGSRTVTYSAPILFPVGKWVTMTATPTDDGGPTGFGSTSEFSRAVQVTDASADPLTVTITPTSPSPPIVLQRGDFVFFDVTFEVGPTGPSSFEFWTEAVLPNGSVRSPLIGPNTVNVSPPASVTLSFSQRVPNRAPFGSYTYRVEAGTFPSGVLDSDSFAAEIVPGRSSNGPEDWQAFDAEGTLLDGPQVYDFRDGETEATEAASSESLPAEAALSGAYPNPFSQSATVGFALPSSQRVVLTVYDVLGRKVAVLADGEIEAGRHEAVLDGASLPSGVYLVRLATDGTVQTQRLTLIR